MEKEKTISEEEKLLIISSSIILAGISSNYTSRYPTETHATVAKGIAQYLMDTILKSTL